MKNFISGFEKKANIATVFKGLAKKTKGATEATLDYKKLVPKSQAPDRVLDYSKMPKNVSPLAEKATSPSLDYSKINKIAPPPPVTPAPRVDSQVAAANRLKQVQANSTPPSIWNKALAQGVKG